jgi:3alpha(or 20beta)-hydroxysteroid dehydrogenase
MDASNMSLTGRVALITGAAQGQGAAEAKLFTAHGAKVVLTDVRDEHGKALAETLQGATYAHLDVTDEAAWEQMITQVLASHGGLHILVNNAGISHFSAIEELPLADFRRVLDINLLGTYLGMKHSLRALKVDGGSIINVTSIAALTGRAGLGAYAASKWAVRGLSRAAALEFAPYKVRVNSIIPGVIETPMTQDAYGTEQMLQRGAQLPVGRVGQPLDIANLALFLASDMSSFCTGGEYLCDGGETAGTRQ